MSHFAVREYGRLRVPSAASSGPVHPSLDEAVIPASAFRHLAELNHGLQAKDRFLRIESETSLQLTHYVGVVETPCGTRIEILPKHVDHASDVVAARRVLRRMLCDALDLSPREADVASLQRFPAPLTEWVMARFLEALDRLVKRGVRFAYQRVEDERRYLRGQLDVARQARQRPGRGHVFHLRHDEYVSDRPENRLLCSALDKACRHTRSPDNWRLAHELAMRLADVPRSANHDADFRAWQADRTMVDYAPVRPWCSLVLGQAMPLALRGDWHGISMLFPAEKLFERHVAARLRGRLLPGAQLKAPAASHYLCEHEERQVFRLEPDLLLWRGDRRWVFDTKWKRLDAADRENNYGLDQADFYQLYAYGQKYLGSNGRMALVYPQTARLQAPLPVFRYSADLELWVLPFDLERGELLLPDGVDGWPVVRAIVDQVVAMRSGARS